jgi:hypothetical protein
MAREREIERLDGSRYFRVYQDRGKPVRRARDRNSTATSNPKTTPTMIACPIPDSVSRPQCAVE